MSNNVRIKCSGQISISTITSAYGGGEINALQRVQVIKAGTKYGQEQYIVSRKSCGNAEAGDINQCGCTYLDRNNGGVI